MNTSTNTRIVRLAAYLRTGGSRTLGYFIAIGTVTAVAARVSYAHIREITLVAGQPTDVATVLPLAVDGMLLAASLAMAEDKANGRKPRLWARVGFWFGAAISLACNVASTVVHAPLDDPLIALRIFIATLAPALLLITVEIMARRGPIDESEQAEPTPAPERRQKTDDERLEDARRRAGYYQKDTAGRTAWTREWNKRETRRKERDAATAPTSPGHPPVEAPAADEVAEVVG